MLTGKRVLVIGLARSGKAAVKLLQKLNATITINEGKPLEQIDGYQEYLDAGIEIVAGGHPDELFERDFDFVVKNPGINYHKQIRNLNFHVGGNFSFNRSKVIEMGEEYQPYEWMRTTGQTVGQIMGYEAIGFFKDEQDIKNSPVQMFGEVKPGDIKFRDLNGDKIIDERDKKAIGYSSVAPEIYYSLNLGVEYKGFGIDALIQGVGNYSDIASTAGLFRPLSNNTSLTQYYYENRWTPQNQQAKYPRLSQGANANNFTNNTVWLTDKSYLKLRHAELYYKFSKKLLATTPLHSVKLYVRASDFTLFDHVDICDPEAMGNALPIPSSVQLGFSIGF